MGMFTDLAENKLIDALYRGQALGAPATWYHGLIVATRGFSNSIRSTAVSSGDTVIPATPNGHIYRCTTAGTTGSGEPTWPTTNNGTVTDGTAVWTEMYADLEAGNSNVKEVTGGSYARVGVTASLANFAGTQSVGSTTTSSGATGTTSNNNSITFAAPSANWGVIWGSGLWDASSAGNLWEYEALTTPKTVNNGDPAPSFAAAAYTHQIDN